MRIASSILCLSVDELSQDEAESAVAWAKQQVEKRQAEMDLGPFRTQEPAAAKGGGMGDEDFMAALSRAFAESEQQRASEEDVPESHVKGYSFKRRGARLPGGRRLPRRTRP